MDSANSGSMQSSSGGDEEYDSSSHPHDNNFLLNHQTTRSLNHLSAANSSNPSAFLYSNDSYNNILNPFSHSPSTTSTSLYNINNNNNNIQDFWSSKPQTTTTTNIINITNTSQNDQTPSTHQSDNHHPLSQPPDHNLSSTAPKNPKKRTRASRRAPTTVLTTDTTNFRQMVQEFTGIPAAPFSAATSAFSRRLDLFNTAARGESLIYPLRPSAQKVANMQPSSSLYNMGDNSFANIATSLQQPQQNAMNLQRNSMLNYQSVLQSQHQDQANTSQESSRNIPILDDDEVEHFGSFNATNVQLKDGGKGSY